MQVTQNILEPTDEYSWEGNSQESIILHTTLGSSYLGAEETLKIRHLSYHFIINEFGDINQLVDVDRSAWHSGVKSNPSPRAVAFFGDSNPNKRSVGIAFVRNGQDRLTNAQRDAGVYLIKKIGAWTGVRYNHENIFYHREVTDYKPSEVSNYRDQILDGLVGYRDEADTGHKDKQEELIKLLLQLIKLLQAELAKQQDEN